MDVVTWLHANTGRVHASFPALGRTVSVELSRRTAKELAAALTAALEVAEQNGIEDLGSVLSDLGIIEARPA